MSTAAKVGSDAGFLATAYVGVFGDGFCGSCGVCHSWRRPEAEALVESWQTSCVAAADAGFGTRAVSAAVSDGGRLRQGRGAGSLCLFGRSWRRL